MSTPPDSPYKLSQRATETTIRNARSGGYYNPTPSSRSAIRRGFRKAMNVSGRQLKAKLKSVRRLDKIAQARTIALESQRVAEEALGD